MNQHSDVEHIFRHEYGLIVASLLRRVGSPHLEAVEDAVQFAMMQALECWVRQGRPDNPSAWLYKVAYRKLLTEFRNTQRRTQLLAEQSTPLQEASVTDAEIPLQGEMTDSLLRMLFVTCHDTIPVESQLVFTLKSLCGFSVKEIAQRLLITEANTYKRFGRARLFFENQVSALDTLTDADLVNRLPTVHQVLYLVFTEGYLSSHSDMAIRKDLCDEAIRLAELLSDSTLGQLPETYALLALMYLHRSRMVTRQDDLGALLLLEQQDRGQWNQQLIAVGLAYLERSAQGENISRYHIEAGIAAEHCLAPSFEQTRWDRIVASYELLESITKSPIVVLNKALALAEWQGPDAGLAILRNLDLPDWLERSYHWYAVKADLSLRCGELSSALEAAKLATKLAPSTNIKNLLYRRLKDCGLTPPSVNQ